MIKETATIGAAVLISTFAAQAQETSGNEVHLKTILVTGGLTPVEQEESGRAFTIIDGEELREQQIRYVADALRQVPGFAVSRAGSPGGLTQLRVRGAEANHVKVMIDGVSVAETSNGEFDFGSLLVDNIDRIEILRGPQSAFWGANAMAGVVNIITKRGERNGFTASARSEAGSDGTWLGGVSLSGGGENYDIALSGVYQDVGGFNISDFGDERDGDRNATLNGRFNADLSESLSVDGTFRHVNRKSDYDPQDYSSGLIVDGPDYSTSREFFGSLGATHTSFDGALTQKARFTGGDIHRKTDSAGWLNWDDGNRYNGAYQASYEFQNPGLPDIKHQLTGGYVWEHETFRPSHLDETFGRTTNSLVGEYRGSFLDRFFVNAALRHDFNDRFADATTYSLSGAWKISDVTRLHASVGTGVTNPTFYEQYGYFPNYFVGNPDLQPEKSFGWDIGIEQRFFDGRLVADITWFNQDLTDEIESFGDTVINRLGVSKRHGIEIGASVDLFNGFSANASYTWTKASEPDSAGDTRIAEVRRPEHSGSLGLAYRFYDNRARIFGEVVFNGRMEDNAFVPGLPPRVMLPAYTVANIGGSFKVSEHLEAYGRVNNLFDADYQEVFGYNTQGLTAFAGLRGTF